MLAADFRWRYRVNPLPTVPPAPPEHVIASLPLERLSVEAARALDSAVQIATERNSGYIGTEHVLLGLFGQSDSIGARGLRSLGISENAVRNAIEAGVEKIGSQTGSPVPSTRLAHALMRSIASHAEDPVIDSGVLVDAVIDGDGIGGIILRDSGVTPQRWKSARAELGMDPQEAVSKAPSPGTSSLLIRRGHARLVLELVGEARSDFAAALASATTDSQIGVATNNLAWTDLYIGDHARFAEALLLAQRAVEKLPNDPNIHGTHAFALIENGLPAEGVEELNSVGVQGWDDWTTAARASVLALGVARTGNRMYAEILVEIAQQLQPAPNLVTRAREEIAAAIQESPPTRALPQGAIAARVQSIRVHPEQGKKVVLVLSGPNQQLFPIWLGPKQADRIVRLLSAQSAPLAGRREWLELLLPALASRGRGITTVIIDRLVDGQFFGAALVSGNPAWAFEVRPSDAAVIALLAGLPIAISPDLWNDHALSPPARRSLFRRILSRILKST
jgi:bifunctional DNase/RNase